MRLFYLQNEIGDRIALNNETGIFLSEPEGLGLEFGDNFADISEGFFRLVAKKHVQRIISGKLNFMTDPYKVYNDFMHWCMSAKKLYFIYKPMAIEYYIHIEIESMQKTEINKLGYMEVPIRLRYLSPWYVPFPAAITTIGKDATPFIIGSDETPRSIFGSDAVPGQDIFSGSTSETYTSEIHADGHLPAALKIVFKGIADKPVFRLVGKETGIEYGKCSLSVTYDVDTTIELSTMYEDSYVKSIDLLGKETDLLEYLDLTTEPFFKMPIGEDCILTMTDAGTLSGRLDGSIYYYYRSV